MDYNSLLLYSFIAGLFFICLFATIGAVLSRKLNFNYAYLSILSTALYAIIAYEVCAGLNLKSAIIVNSFLALFDSTTGFLLSIWCKSNSGYTKEQSLKMIGFKTTTGAIMYVLVLTFIGYGMSLI